MQSVKHHYQHYNYYFYFHKTRYVNNVWPSTATITVFDLRLHFVTRKYTHAQHMRQAAGNDGGYFSWRIDSPTRFKHEGASKKVTHTALFSNLLPQKHICRRQRDNFNHKCKMSIRTLLCVQRPVLTPAPSRQWLDLRGVFRPYLQINRLLIRCCLAFCG